MLGVLICIGVLTLIYLLAIKPLYYWSSRNVVTGQVTPVFGDYFSVMLGKESTTDMIVRMYKKLQDVRYIGTYQFTKPVLLLRSPELIKQLCVKDYDHFLDHTSLLPGTKDELWSKNLFSLKGQHWKDMRSTVSPSFTSLKMKAMFIFICESANSFVSHFLKKNEEVIEVDFKDAYTRYTSDVIANTAFGIEVDSLEDRENQFYVMGRETTDFSKPRIGLVFLIYALMPKLAAFFNISIFGPEAKPFFLNLVKDTIKMREEKKIKRTDMLGLLLEARKGQQKDQTPEVSEKNSFASVEEHLEVKHGQQNLSDMDITSQVFMFFLGGFETVSTGMCFITYELAANPDIQQKLIEEIDANRPATGAPSYETVMNMTYLDMVISETLRKWPLTGTADRVVTKPYMIQPELPHEKPVYLEEGTSILVPIYAIHYDPEYYENPEKFDPERFSPDNRKNIKPYTYMPFGVGPRNCIGSRFALLEIKAVIFYLLSNFEIVPIEKSQIPIQISKSAIALTPEKGFHFGLKKRD